MLLTISLVVIAAAGGGRPTVPSAAVVSPQRDQLSEKPLVSSKRRKRCLMLISDTGGGHRASAEALKDILESLGEQQLPGGVDVSVVDIWTDHAPWTAYPFHRIVRDYELLSRRATTSVFWRAVWRLTYHISSRFLEWPWCLHMWLACRRSFAQCIADEKPDLIVSLHPLCQNLPLTVIPRLKRQQKIGSGTRFATVCTDLGSAHRAWFNKGVDACFVPSEPLLEIALERRVPRKKVMLHGLPVRRDFWRASDAATRVESRRAAIERLGLKPGMKTVLVLGGGNGASDLAKIVQATALRLGADCAGKAQVVALCGRNEALRASLEKKRGAWKGVHVEVRGFTPDVSSYMEAADCLITKAGPGTIAEAAIRGLPTMLSSYLPGQEWGNVGFVEQHGFGLRGFGVNGFSRPRMIAKTVAGWLADERELERMSAAALAVAAPHATELIAKDLLRLLDEVP